ncbi:MAG TPA: tRNA (adenosine(37)-N6)-threonylcarbamoyltransferase complex ATPase subunit type 1 TsaE [Macromonas sp.]|nr:tRNA (adenosine(37)-N6)-threonylcarbamoyltransferase complex ATPase subunit type 1 TsaE [Macromonas sp.]
MASNQTPAPSENSVAASAWPRLADWGTLCATEDDTGALAQRLARQAGLGQAVLTLHGDLGAGKTTFVRHLLRALGVSGRIKSPTYAVVEPHQAPPAPPWPEGLRVSHFDFYRFNDPREWEDAGFRDVFAEAGLKLVEWPEKAQGLLPTPDLSLHLTPMDDDQRQLDIHAHTPRGCALLEGLRP